MTVIPGERGHINHSLPSSYIDPQIQLVNFTNLLCAPQVNPIFLDLGGSKMEEAEGAI